MKRTVLPAVLSLVLTGSMAFAQTATQPAAPQHQIAGHRHNPHKEAVRLSRKLNLTPDQTAKLEPILADRDQKITALRSNATLTPDDRKAQRMSIAKDTRQQLSTVLTPDQIEQMKALRRHERKAQEAAAPSTPNS